MKIMKVCCQGCGADLEVEEGIRFVNCNYCGAKLEVVQDSTTTHTRVLERLEKQTGEIAEDLKVIRLQNDLEKLDRDWERQIQGFMVTGRHGRRDLPTTGGSAIGGVVAIIFGVVWMGLAGSIGAPAPFLLFGLLFIGLAFFGMIRNSSKATQYRNSRNEMESRRAHLIRSIEEAKQR